MAHDGSRLADPQSGEIDEAVAGRDEGRQVFEAVGVGAEDDRAQHLGPGRDQDHESHPAALLRAQRLACGKQQRPGCGPDRELLVGARAGVQAEERGYHHENGGPERQRVGEHSCHSTVYSQHGADRITSPARTACQPCAISVRV